MKNNITNKCSKYFREIYAVNWWATLEQSFDAKYLFENKVVIDKKLKKSQEQIDYMSKPGQQVHVDKSCVFIVDDFYKKISQNDYSILSQAYDKQVQKIEASRPKASNSCSKTKLESVPGISKLDLFGIRVDGCVQDIPLNSCNQGWGIARINYFKEFYLDSKKLQPGSMEYAKESHKVDSDFGLVAAEITNNYPKYFFGVPLDKISDQTYEDTINQATSNWSKGVLPAEVSKQEVLSIVSCGEIFHATLSPSGKILGMEVKNRVDDKSNSNGQILAGILKDFGISGNSLKKSGYCSDKNFGDPCDVTGILDNKVGISIKIAGGGVYIDLFDLRVDLSKELKETNDPYRVAKKQSQKLNY